MKREAVVFAIDDDEAVRDAFTLALVDDPYKVLAFSNGKDALDAAESTRPDLVFLDLNMPVMDGVETMKMLRQQDPSIRIYVVTAFAEEYMDRLRDARNEGLTFQVASKPISDEQIRLIASSALG